jgi:hypothetical protein
MAQLAVILDDLRRCDSDVISGNPELFGERSAGDRGPVLDIAVPEIGQLDRPLARRRRQQLGAGDERSNAHRERKGIDAGILLPAILFGARPPASDKAERAACHVCDFDARKCVAFVERGGEQHWERGFVELDALPVRPTAEPLVWCQWPSSICVAIR